MKVGSGSKANLKNLFNKKRKQKQKANKIPHYFLKDLVMVTVLYNILPVLFLCSGYKPASERHRRAHKQVKRDEVVLFDNVKEYSHRPGKYINIVCIIL